MSVEPADEALLDSQEAGQECSLVGCLTGTGTAGLWFPVEKFRKLDKGIFIRWYHGFIVAELS